MLRRRSAGPLLLLLVLGLAGAATARDHAATTGSVAHAFAFKVVEPGQAAAGTPFVAAPPSAADSGTAFALSAAPTGVASGAYSAAVQADSSERTGSAEAQSTVTALSLFDGELRADRIVATAQASATARTASGSVDQSSITNLTLGGQPLDVVPNGRIALGDWGYAVTLVRTETAGQAGTNGYHGTIVALDIHLSADHGGLPANTEIQVGYADAAAQASPPPPPATTTVVKPAPRVGRPRKHVKQPKAPEPNLKHPASITKAPPKNVHVKLSPEGYVFPVYGPCSFVDTFGAGRADVGWHHGEDLFAPLGAPILAVADGTVFMVGWNTIGGNRVWLKDEQGNEYYYAHLSAFSTLAVNGSHVKAGTVLGFVGNTGDAQGTPYHLHFEVHPKSLLKMGYDGVVDPTKWLQALVHAQDVAIPQHVAGGPQGPQDTATGSPSTPLPGAVLLQESDISSADGLDPASLRRVFEPAPFEGTITLSGGTPLDRG